MIPQSTGASIEALAALQSEVDAVTAESAGTTADVAALSALCGNLDSVLGGAGQPADVADLVSLMGDVGSVVGPDAPPGCSADLTAGFVSLITDLNGKLSTNRLKAGTITVNGGASTGTADTGTGWNGKPVLAAPNGSLGAVLWHVSLSNGVVTITTSMALAGPVTFSYFVADLS